MDVVISTNDETPDLNGSKNVSRTLSEKTDVFLPETNSDSEFLTSTPKTKHGQDTSKDGK